MKPITVNVQITKNPRQYEAVRLGMEVSVDAGETAEQVIKAVTLQLNEMYADMYLQKPAHTPTAEEELRAAQRLAKEWAAGKSTPTESETAEPEQPKRELLKFGDRKLQLIIRKIEQAGTPERVHEVLENAHKYFDFDEEATRVLELATKLNV